MFYLKRFFYFCSATKNNNLPYLAGNVSEAETAWIFLTFDF